MAEKTKPEGEETEAKGGKKKLLVIVAVLLVAVGAGAYFFLFSGSGDAKAAAPEKGAVVALDPIAVNLAGGGYLKIGVALQLTADAGEEKPDGSEALDLVISTYSQAQPADVKDKRDALKAHLEKEIEEAYDGDVMGIYLTQYVTQ
jgi:flagellar FliL protein